MEPIHLFHLLLFLALPLLFELYSVTCNAHVQCLQAESSALLQLKQGFISNELDTWRAGTNCCIWKGLTCDDESGRVIGLDLSDQSIAGKIDSSLFNLTSLHTLNFAENFFYQIPIPNFGWDKLANLSRLDLSSAGFVGNVPAGIFRLKKLTYLRLSHNIELSLTNIPTFMPNMSNLEELYLDGVKLSDKWCGSLVNSTPVLEVLSMSFCTLYGARCSSLSMLPFLSVLNLGGNNLDSNILDSFVNLTSLSMLEVDENGFKGFFPMQIFRMRTLKHLQVSYNPMLSGSLPDFSVDSNLEHMDLTGTNFSGNLPNTISNLKFLTDLEISNCQFSGTLPLTMRNLSTLGGLNLSNNKFSGVVELEFIRDLKYLILLDLSNSGFSLSSWDVDDGSFSSFFSHILLLGLAGCNLTKIPASIKYHQMFELDLSNNKIHGEIPSWFWSIGRLNLSCNFFTHITEPPFNLFANPFSGCVDLHSNMLEGPIPRLPLIDIIILDFSNNRFSSFIPANMFSSLYSTKFFSLANNNLTGQIPPSICNLTYLTILDLSNNSLTGSIPPSICNLTYLIVLDLSNNMLIGSIPPCLLEEGNNLIVLNLNENQLQGVIPEGISPKCKLQTINLRDNQLEGLLPRTLSNCRSLMILDLGDNNLKDTFPYWLGNMTLLRVLVLRSNKFHGLIGFIDENHYTNSTFSMLHVFDISSNNFSGKLCENSFSNFQSMMVNRLITAENFAYDIMGNLYEFEVLTIMNKGQLMTIHKIWMYVNSIDISDNHFEGEIPISIGRLISLQVLNMSHNYLTGKIPPQIGNLLQLESLDLSTNNLSGKIPQELVSLSFLEYLNLSYNKLVGKIPKGGQFSTFPNTSFEGNEGLCCWLPYNTSVSGLNNTVPSPSSLHETTSKSRSYMIVLGILFGVGFGLCMATIVVIDAIYFDEVFMRRILNRPLQ